MSDYVKRAEGLADQYLSMLAASQEQFLKSLETVTASMPKVAPTPTPFTADLPTPGELAEANFAFAAKLLKQQKEFTDRLFAGQAS
jgi:hypothetical protein